jgi:cysteinyl-tRNA synthetase
MSMDELLVPFGGGLACNDPDKNVFDIHGGGIDLVFPHHENELAQSCCAFATSRMANIWMHNGFLQVEGQKMSKSLGNFVTIHELLATRNFGGRAWHGDVLRLAMLRTHYRQPIDWTVKALEEAEQTLDRWHDEVGDVSVTEQAPAPAVLEAMEDDLNTPAAIAELHRLAHPAVAGVVMAGVSRAGQSRAPALLKASANLLGLMRLTRSEWRALRARERSAEETQEVESLFAERNAARVARDWAASDRLRDRLVSLGVSVKDSKDGSSWEWAP